MTEREQQVFRERARRLARPATLAETRVVACRVAVVTVAGQRLGLPVEALREVGELPPVTSVSSPHAWLRGITQVRGEILGVVDLAALLGRPGGTARFLAILTHAGRAFGVAIDEVSEVRVVYRDEFPEGLAAAGDRPFAGTTRDLLTLVDVARLVAQQEPVR